MLWRLLTRERERQNGKKRLERQRKDGACGVRVWRQREEERERIPKKSKKVIEGKMREGGPMKARREKDNTNAEEGPGM